MKLLLLSFSVLLLTFSFANAETVHFDASDGVKVTADFNTPNDSFSTIIVLYHMAGSSRGEYVEIADRLNRFGYATLAVDQRSGGEFNGIRNETVKSAGGSTDYIDAIPDILAASNWARQESGARNVGVLGSSYSAGLVLVLSAQDPAFADAVMSFSPGEYFGSSDYVAQELDSISVPVFLTSARAEIGQWQSFETNIESPVDGFVPTGTGRHGASSLNSADGAEYWSALEDFLDRNLPIN